MSDTTPEFGLSIHRTEALTDGIYAVAMTLLVIDLKLPDRAVLHSQADIADAIVALEPKFFAWVISFCVLAFFWMGHHRAYHHVRRTDGRLIAFTLAQLAFVSLMPFSCELLGEHTGLLPQAVYALNLTMLAISALAISGWIYAHPQLSTAPMPLAAFVSAAVRAGGLIVVSLATVPIEARFPGGYASLAFLLMAVIFPISRRLERAIGRAGRAPAPG